MRSNNTLASLPASNARIPITCDRVFLESRVGSSSSAPRRARDPHLVVHSESADEVAILEGVAEEVADPASLDGALRAKYGLETGDVEDVWYALRQYVRESTLTEDKADQVRTAARLNYPGEKVPSGHE